MGHAVQGQRNMGRQMKDPTPYNREMDFDVSRLEHLLRPIARENPQTLSETNPDGSPRTLKDVAEDANSPPLTRLLAALGKENMTISEYNQLNIYEPI